MSENFTRAAHLLSLTYSGNSEQIRQAEEELKIISQDTQGYSSFLLTLITAMESPQLLRSAAATRFRHFMRESISAGKITAELKSLMVEMIYQGLISPYIDKTTRGVLNFSLNPLLAEDGMGVCASRLASLAINGLNGEGSQIQGSLLVIKSIFSSMTPQFQTGEYSRILVPHLVEVGKKGLYLINSGIQTSNESLGMEGMNVLEDWTATLRQILEHFEVASSKGTKEFLEYSEIAIIFTSIMNFVLPDYRLGNVVINITDTQMNKTLNCIKVNVLKSLNILITFVIEFKKKLLEEQGAYPKVMTLVGSELPHSPFVNLCSSILEPLITAVISISHQPDINDLMTFDYVSDILIEAMKLFHKCCTETLFYGVFAQYHKSLIVDVCFNFIRVLDKDRELFEEHPEEFVSSTQDVCERQESETIKTCAAQVLESLCESVDGALAFVTYFVYQVCDMILSGKSSDAIMEYNVIKDHADSKFINLDEEIKLEASFMILSVLSFVISSRKDLTEVIESLLSTYIGRLFSVTSGIVQNRVCLFLYFYAENIFTEKSEHFKSCMHFVMNCVSPGHSRAVIIQASETFGNIMQDQEIMFRLEPFIDEIIDKAVQAIPNQTEKSFFEALVELVQNFSESIAEKIVPLIIGVVQKIEIEAQIIVTSGKKESIIMIKLWNIIRSLITASTVQAAQLGEFERLLLPVLSYLNIPDKITFGDELISILICFIKKTKKISDIEWEIFNHLPVIQASQNNELHGLFKLVNQYIIHGKEHLQDSPHKIQQILDMAGKGMFASHKGKVRESSNSEGALIYQLMLFDYGGFIDHHLEQIYSNTFLRYLQNVNHDFFKVRLLGIILAGITYNPQLSFAILVRNTTPQGISYLRFSLIQIINHSTLFAHSYDKRLAVIGICNLLNQPNLPTDVSELISQIFEALIIILSLKMSDGEAQVKEKQKSPIDALMETLFDSDEENDFENDIVVKGTKLLYGNSSESGVNKSEEIEANLLLSYVNSPIQSLDEYDYFRRTLAEIKSHNPDLIKHLASNLSPQRRDQLLEIVQCQRVQINNLPGENTVVRKIVKAKHR